MFNVAKCTVQQIGDKKSPGPRCQSVPLPGEIGESLTERKPSRDLGLVRWKSLPIWANIEGKAGEMQVPGTACGLAQMEQRARRESSKRRECRGWWGQTGKEAFATTAVLGCLCAPKWSCQVGQIYTLCLWDNVLSKHLAWTSGPNFWGCNTHIYAQF